MSVRVKKKEKKRKRSQEFVTSNNDVETASACPPSGSKPGCSEQSPIDGGEFSLATLNENLKSNGHYLNAVKYYNIASDVVWSVAVGEGQKIFRGIKRVVAEYCANGNEQIPALEKMLELRSKLSSFKSSLDRLVSLIMDEKRIPIARHVEKTSFDALAKSLMALLRTRWTQRRRVCRRILRVNLKDHDKAHIPFFSFTPFQPIMIRFEEYYLTEPLLNVKRLYHFVANEL